MLVATSTQGEISCVVHGDDVAVIGRNKHFDWFWIQISNKLQSKHRGRIGPEESDLKEIRILNRIVTWTDRGITYEADQRHVEICLQEVGLEAHSKTISTPTDRSAKDSRNRSAVVNSESDAERLKPCAATKYRGIAARKNYLGQDGSEIQFAVKELSRIMSKPTSVDWSALKILGRYLFGRDRMAIGFGYQEKVQGIEVWTDIDYVGSIETRKSTSGGWIGLGYHLVKSWSTTQGGAISVFRGG